MDLVPWTKSIFSDGAFSNKSFIYYSAATTRLRNKRNRNTIQNQSPINQSLGQKHFSNILIFRDLDTPKWSLRELHSTRTCSECPSTYGVFISIKPLMVCFIPMAPWSTL